MEDFWNKLVKLTAVTGVCSAAFMAMVVQAAYGSIGGNEVFKAFQSGSTMIISGTQTTTLMVLSNSFVVLTYNLSMLYLTVFIVGVWLFSVTFILQKEIGETGSWLKGATRSFIHELSKPKTESK